jgi:hypothetical protein
MTSLTVNRTEPSSARQYNFSSSFPALTFPAYVQDALCTMSRCHKDLDHPIVKHEINFESCKNITIQLQQFSRYLYLYRTIPKEIPNENSRASLEVK